MRRGTIIGACSPSITPVMCSLSWKPAKKKSLAIISPGQLGHCNTFFVVNFKKVLHDSRYFVEFLHEAAEGQVEEGW
jgi:hypothetical protein